MKHLIQLVINALARRLKLYGKGPLPPSIETIPMAERLSSEAQLLSMFRLGEAQGEKKGYQEGRASSLQERTTVYIDPLMRQRGYAQSAWNSEPVPRTDPQLQARLEAQKRKEDMKAFLKCDSGELPHLPGELMRKHTTRKLTIANTDTVNVPAVTRMPHKSYLMLHSGLYPGETAHSTPAFLQDQDKKIS